MKHAIVSTGHASYEEAFDVAAKIVGTKRKTSWHGKVRIKYRKAIGTFEVQIPAAIP